MRPVHLLFATIFAVSALILAGCPAQETQTDVPDSNTEQTSAIDETQFQAAINLAKRAVLYKLAYQEGDLAMFTARPETVEGMNVPEIPRQMNTHWWSIPWDTARLQPLPPTDMSELETVVNDLIAARIEEIDEENTWILITLGYDPDFIKVLIANAHTEWPPEEREPYLAGMLDSCLQVWCVQISGEWKVLAFLSCTPDLVPPSAPAPSGELIEQMTSASQEPAEDAEEETEIGMVEEDPE